MKDTKHEAGVPQIFLLMTIVAKADSIITPTLHQQN